MNLSKLFELQKGLDAPYSHVEDRLSKDILWLMEELGELAREWRGHKYRRADQTPNTEASARPGDRDCMTTVNPLLEEYTDCLSIILSIGLLLEPNLIEEWDIPKQFERYKYNDSVVDYMNMMFTSWNGIDNRNDYYECYWWNFEIFAEIGEMLGFTWEQIEQNYLQKVITNGHRNCQAEGLRDDRTA